MLRYIYIELLESREGLNSCVESSSDKFDSEVENFLSDLRVGYRQVVWIGDEWE